MCTMYANTPNNTLSTLNLVGTWYEESHPLGLKLPLEPRVWETLRTQPYVILIFKIHDMILFIYWILQSNLCPTIMSHVHIPKYVCFDALHQP